MSISTSRDDWEIELLRLLMKARFIRNRYLKDYKDIPPYSIDHYLWLISEETGYDIDIKETDWGSEGFIRGICLPFDGSRVKIRVPRRIEVDTVHGATNCERRYISLKEASHLVIDDEDSYAEDCLALIDSIVFGSCGASVTDLRIDGRSDVFYGKIFAMELLFPAEMREGVKVEIDSGAISTYSAAQRFLVPEKELIWFLSDRMHPGLEHYRKQERSLESEFLRGVHPEAQN